ncbi:MAG: hypothetical protein KGI00_01870 [Candidatus Micrarchaeota archaeon]|nr:hypothetical protein [Candidatus Micrarchaeota archaeon]
MARKALEKRFQLKTLFGGAFRTDYSIQRLAAGRPDRKLMAGLVRTGLESFGKGMTDKEIMEHVLSCDVIFVAFAGAGKPIGFGGSRYLGSDSSAHGRRIDLAGAAVAEEGQGNGIYKALTRARIMQGLDAGCSIITTRTQNPSVESGIIDVMKELKAAGSIMSYGLSRRLAPAAYGRMLTDSVPKSTREDINILYKSLNYAAGDAYVLEFEVVKCDIMHST